MKRITLLRHAKSSWKNPHLSDVDRPLNGRGKSDAPEMGRRLKRTGFRPDAVITSPAKRARRTAQLVAREIGFPPDGVVVEAGIYEAGQEMLLEIVRGLGKDIGHALLVGHNPGFTDLANYLTGEEIENIPTAGVATIEFGTDSWKNIGRSGGDLVHFDYPKNRRT